LIENHNQIQVAEYSVKQTTEHLLAIKNNFEASIIGTSDLK